MTQNIENLKYVEMFPDIDVELIDYIVDQYVNENMIILSLLELSNIESDSDNDNNAKKNDTLSSLEDSNINNRYKNKYNLKSKIFSKKIFEKKRYNKLDND